jgi:hypothetical protein
MIESYMACGRYFSRTQQDKLMAYWACYFCDAKTPQVHMNRFAPTLRHSIPW